MSEIINEALKQALAEKTPLNLRIRNMIPEIIDLVKNHGELSISEIESITKANRNTLKKELQELVNQPNTGFSVRH